MRRGACSRDGGNSGSVSGADCVLEDRGAFQERPTQGVGRAIGACTAKKTSGPSPQGRWRIPVQGPELGGQVTTATPFAPSGAEPGRLSGICSGLASSLSVKNRSRNGPYCRAFERGELGVRNMPLIRAYLLIRHKRQTARGLDIKKSCLWFPTQVLDGLRWTSTAPASGVARGVDDCHSNESVVPHANPRTQSAKVW